MKNNTKKLITLTGAFFALVFLSFFVYAQSNKAFSKEKKGLQSTSSEKVVRSNSPTVSTNRLESAKMKLAKLKADPTASAERIKQLEEAIQKIETEKNSTTTTSASTPKEKFRFSSSQSATKIVLEETKEDIEQADEVNETSTINKDPKLSIKGESKPLDLSSEKATEMLAIAKSKLAKIKARPSSTPEQITAYEKAVAYYEKAVQSASTQPNNKTDNTIATTPKVLKPKTMASSKTKSSPISQELILTRIVETKSKINIIRANPNKYSVEDLAKAENVLKRLKEKEAVLITNEKVENNIVDRRGRTLIPIEEYKGDLEKLPEGVVKVKRNAHDKDADTRNTEYIALPKNEN